MNKELFVSSTPHETKVGLVEDDLLAEIYLERENEYTLAGSIYKGRVTRVLPGMQSAFVDIGLERDAFLYVSDFMELEEHDEDVTDIVPANRGVQDMRPQPCEAEIHPQAPAGGDSRCAEEFEGAPATIREWRRTCRGPIIVSCLWRTREFFRPRSGTWRLAWPPPPPRRTSRRSRRCSQ